MKKFPLIVIASLFLLASCGESSSSSSISKDTSSSSNTSSEESSLPLPVVESHLLTIDVPEGAKLTILEPTSDSYYQEGAKISFSLEIEERFSLDKVTLGTEVLTPSDGIYYFYMPKSDVTLKVSLHTLGEEGLLEVSEVTQELIPSTVDEVVALLNQSSAVSGKYFQKGNYEVHPVDDYDREFSYALEARQDHLLIQGNYRSDLNQQTSLYRKEIRGIEENRYYVYLWEGNSLSSTSSAPYASESLEVKNIVEEESFLANEILKEEAEKNISSYDFPNLILGEFFNEDAYEGSFTGYAALSAITIRNELNLETRKSFVTTLTGYDDNYLGITYYSLALTFDGDAFLTNFDASIEEYAYEDFDQATGKPISEKNPTKEGSVHMDAVRGYKPYEVSPISLHDYAMDNYEVSIFYTQEGGEKQEVKNGEVEVGSTLSFQFLSSDSHPYLIKPTLVGAKEEGFIEESYSGNYVVLKEGDFTLLFDNGVGEIKEISLHALTPKPTKISATLSSNSVFVGSNLTLSVNVTPTAADNSYKVEIDESSLGEVTISKNEDNTTTLTGVSIGEVTLKITSLIDETVSTSVTFEVIQAPNYEDVLSTLLSSTMSYEDGGYSEKDAFYMNFNEDGTGSYVYGTYEFDYMTYDYAWSFEEIVNFHYAIDENTLAISLTYDQEPGYGDAKIHSISVLTNNTLEVSIVFYDSPDDPFTLEASSRVDDLQTIIDEKVGY